MKKSLLLAISISIGVIANAQNVGINATGAAPNADAILDIASTSKGLLIPRVSIGNVALAAPVTAPTTSLLVYNTNAGIIGGTGVGYYYWDGVQWQNFWTGGNFNVDNGLYYNAGAQRVRMGGPLVENTTITQAGFSLDLNLNGTGDFSVQDAGTDIFQIRDDGIAFFGDDVYWRDVNVTGTNLMSLIDDGDDGRLRIYENGGTSVDLDANTQFIFNEQGLDRDFRIESDGVTSMFHVDASTNRVGVGTAAPVDRFHVSGGRVEFTNTNDASGTAGSGVLEIGNALRLDGNEMITNTNTPLYLQNDNNGDLIVDATTFNVDASLNVVGLSAMPAAPYILGAGIPVHTVAYPVEIGSDGNGGQQIGIGYYRGGDPTMNPEQNGGWGYVGYNVAAAGEYWWRMYSGGFINASQREIKRNINTISGNDNLENYIVNSILSMKPSLYNYHNEYDEMKPGLENHYRPAFRIGLIADETPDYILDEGFSGVDIYGLATLSLAGVQRNIKEIEKLKTGNAVVQDFGSMQLTAKTVWVNYSENFEGNIPVVTLTSNNANVVLSIVEKNEKGFKVVASSTAPNLTFDWIAMAKVKQTNQNSASSTTLPNNIKDKLEIPEAKKAQIKGFYENFEPTLTPTSLK